MGRGRGKNKVRTCVVCGDGFDVFNAWALTCGAKCRKAKSRAAARFAIVRRTSTKSSRKRSKRSGAITNRRGRGRKGV